MRMRLSSQPDFVGANWEPFTADRLWNFGDSSVLYVQFRDNAENISQTYTVTFTGEQICVSALRDALGCRSSMHPRSQAMLHQGFLNVIVFFVWLHVLWIGSCN